MKKKLMTFHKEIFQILKEGFLLYFKSIFRLSAVVAWICLPVSIFSVLIFYWGLSQRVLEILSVLIFWGCFVLFLFLQALVLKVFHSLSEGKGETIWELYEKGFLNFFSYLKILGLIALRVSLWAAPFFYVVLMVSNGSHESGMAWFWLITLLSLHVWAFFPITVNVLAWVFPFYATFLTTGYIAKFKGFVLLWPVSFLLLIPVGLIVCYYSFAGFALIVDGLKGIDALKQSKQLIKANGKQLVGIVILLSVVMFPLYKLIFEAMSQVQEIPLKAANLFPLLLSNCVVNFFSILVIFLPTAFYFCLYKRFKLINDKFSIMQGMRAG